MQQEIKEITIKFVGKPSDKALKNFGHWMMEIEKDLENKGK